jgi:NADH-quinone oxidoreductase subunit L
VAGAIGIAAIVAAFGCGIAALIALQGEPSEARVATSSLWEYANVGGFQIDLGIYVDPLAVMMVLIVTGVSSLIHIYSYSYMQSDEGYHRFFSYLNFFVFSMLLLVLAGNFVLLIVGWAFVGFASSALISYWYRRVTRPRRHEGLRHQRGRRHRPGAAAILIREIGSVDYGTVREGPDVFATNEWTVVAICLFLLVGIRQVGRCRSTPTRWKVRPGLLADHAATMAAGVYLIARPRSSNSHRPRPAPCLWASPPC